ncbi:hypothetical protein V1281_002570 [Nitrobacteraceae bacterium AZCC 2161]
MIRFLAAALLCAFFAAPADAGQHHRRAVIQLDPGCNVLWPCVPMAGQIPVVTNNFLDGVRSISVTMRKERGAKTGGARPRARFRESMPPASAFGVPSPSLEYTMRTGAERVARPARYIAGRLICAVNVNSALAERGIRGTGSALAKSFLGWGRASAPVAGAVAVSGRRGGGHVAIVSRVEGNQVYVWNPSPRGRGWQEVAYRHRAISYRVPG